MDMFDHLYDLPMSPQESAWLHDRMETLSVKESMIFSAAILRKAPKCGADAINHLLSLPDHEVCAPAGSYAQLGQFYLDYESSVPKRLYPYIDKEQLGMRYERDHPGMFIGNCFVQFPSKEPSIPYDGTNLSALEDTSWSVKLKLASEQKPEGVWLRLPDYSESNDERPDEISLALNKLGADTIADCSVLDAKCTLPGISDLMSQYHSLADLIYDGQSLGFVLDEQGQGMPNFMERFAAALEYEDCARLDFALDISQNLACYNFVPAAGVKDFATKSLLDQGMPEDMIVSGCVDLDAYAEDVLGQQGYILTGDENSYIGRNERPFVHEFSTKSLPGMVLE